MTKNLGYYLSEMILGSVVLNANCFIGELKSFGEWIFKNVILFTNAEINLQVHLDYLNGEYS